MCWDVADSIGKVRQRKTGGYYVCFGRQGAIWSVPNPSGGRGIKFTRELADRVLASVRNNIAAGQTLGSALSPWLAKTRDDQLVLTRAKNWLEHQRARVESRSLSPTYVRELERYVLHPGYWPGFLKDVPITGVTTRLVDDFDLWLGQKGGANGTGLSPATRNKVLGALRAFLGWLRRRGEITFDQIPELPRIEIPEHSPQIISSSDQQAVKEAIPHERRGAFLACCHGLRPGEARASAIGDYTEGDDGQGWLTVDKAYKGPNATAPILHTKQKKIRAIPVDNELRDWIRWRLEARVEAMRTGGPAFLLSPALFPNPTARNPERRWITSAMEREWNRACLKVGTSAKLYEGTKHSYATGLREGGVPLDIIQRILGHSDIKSTERYGRLRDPALVKLLRPR